MTPRHARAAVCASVVLSIGVAVNVILLQRDLAIKHPWRGSFEPGAPTPSADGGRDASADRSTGHSASRPSEPLSAPVAHDDQTKGHAIANAQSLPSRSDHAPSDASRTVEAPGVPPASDADDIIRGIQRELRQRGYEPGAANGVASPTTRAAIMAYQRDHGLPLTGEPSEELLKAIVFETSAVPRTPRTGGSAERRNHSERVRTLQQWLAALGYTVGKIDGRIGEETRQAIRKFETDQGLPATGRVSGQLVAQLTRVGGLLRRAAGQ
jgi:peptidoglycan hydrolase-like protein with peptidoglycan-binding domain